MSRDCTSYIHSSPPRHRPSSHHGEHIEAVGAALLDAHCCTHHHPAGGAFTGDAQRLVGVDAR